MIRILIVDDNAVIRHGLESLLGDCDGLAVVGQAATGRQAMEVAAATQPDVVLLDVRMPVMDGIAALPTLAKSARVLMLTYSDDEPSVIGAIRAGAAGYLVHGRFGTDELAQAVHDVAAGATVVSPAVTPLVVDALRNDSRLPLPDAGPQGLTEREIDLMNLMARGLSNSAIAAELFLSEKTIKNYINRTYAKLGVRSRGEAIATWLGVAV